MKFLRRILGIFVMIAGILGLGISLAGLVGLWMVKPTIASYAKSTIDTLNTSITTSEPDDDQLKVGLAALTAAGFMVAMIARMGRPRVPRG